MLPILIDRLNGRTGTVIRNKFAFLPTQNFVKGVCSFLFTAFGVDNLSFVQIDNPLFSVSRDNQRGGQPTQAIHLNNICQLETKNFSPKSFFITDQIDNNSP